MATQGDAVVGHAIRADWNLASTPIVEGGSKWRRGAAEFGGAGWVKFSERGVAVAV